MNKKGFTLIELLATIAILALLVLLAFPTVLDKFREARKKSFVLEVQNIYKATENTLTKDNLKGSHKSEYNSLNEKIAISNEKIEYVIVINDKNKITSICVNNKDYKYYYDNSNEEINISEIKYNDKFFSTGSCTDDKIVKPTINITNENSCNSSKNITIDFGTFYSGYTYKYLIGETEHIVTSNPPPQMVSSNTTVKAQVYKNDTLIQEEEKDITLIGNLRTITYQFDSSKVDSINGNKTSDTCCDSEGGCNITLPDFTAKINYTKVGWHTNASAATSEYSVNQNVTVKSDITLNAIAKSNAICFPATTEQRKVDLLSDGIVYGNVASGSYNPGDAYLCKVNNNLSYVFFVFSSTETTVDLIYNRNLVAPDRTGPDIYWYNSKSTYYGPIIALAFLKTQTSNWTNISEKTYNYSTSSYYSLTHTARARIPSFTELSNLGVRTNSFVSYIQNPMWLYTNIGTCSSTAYWYPPIDDNACHGNSLGYWTYTVYSSTEAWRVYGAKFLSPRIVNVANTGVRPIITLDKSQISN